MTKRISLLKKFWARSLATILISLLLLACAPMADYQLGREAYRAGDESTAENHFYRLAVMGFPDAQVAYADVLRDRGGPANEQKAEQWYLKAGEKKFANAYGRLGKLYSGWVLDGATGYTEQAEFYIRKAIASNDYSVLDDLIELYFEHRQTLAIDDTELRELIGAIHRYDEGYADYGAAVYYRLSGQLPAQAGKVIDLCEPLLRRIPRCYLEIAAAYRSDPASGDIGRWVNRIERAYRRGEMQAGDVIRMAKWLGSSEQGLPQEALALYELFSSHDPNIVQHRAKLLYDYPAIGDTDSVLEAVEILRRVQPASADLLIGRLYLDGDRLVLDPAKAEEYLLAARPIEPSADYFLGQIYWRGYLGRFEPEQGVAYLLSAARRGYTNADEVLAEVFSFNNGVLPNMVYALSFAELALAQRPDQKLEQLYQEILSKTSAQQRQQAAELKNAELAARSNFAQQNKQLIGSTE
jgi:alginate biosynthesis protein AlgK